MRRMLLATMISTAICTGFAAACGAQTTHTSHAAITVSDAWARASAGPARNSAAYATIKDAGSPDRLTGVSSSVAARTELHETRKENDVMQMRQVGSLPVERAKPLVLAPGGYHVMLFELKQPLQAGESFPLTLTFEKAAPITVQVKVAAAGAMGPMGGARP